VQLTAVSLPSSKTIIETSSEPDGQPVGQEDIGSPPASTRRLCGIDQFPRRDRHGTPWDRRRVLEPSGFLRVYPDDPGSPSTPPSESAASTAPFSPRDLGCILR
jgi:hypothetical protein